jgi:hypothetical protein
VEEAEEETDRAEFTLRYEEKSGSKESNEEGMTIEEEGEEEEAIESKVDEFEAKTEDEPELENEA